MQRHLWVVVPLAFALVVGCNKGPDSSTDTSTTATKDKGSTTGTTTTGATTTGGPAETTPAKPTLKDLTIKDVKAGKGGKVELGDTVWVMYDERYGSPTGTSFDSSEKRQNRPLAINVGGGTVIDGWEKGLLGMQVGGERNIGIPYKLAYGDIGNDVVPAKTDVFINMTAVALVKKGQEDNIDEGIVKKGTGPTPKLGDKVLVSYILKLPSGEEVERKIDKPVSFVLGRPDEKGQRALPGMELSLLRMNVGEEAIYTIPPKLGKPEGAVSFPANSVLIFDVTLKKIN